jgi:hypothetical protein
MEIRIALEEFLRHFPEQRAGVLGLALEVGRPV